MNPCNESFTEINFQPPNQRPLWKKRGEKNKPFKHQKKTQPIMHVWAATQYLYHNKRQAKYRVHYGYNGSRVFWYKVKRHLMRLPIVPSVPHLSCHDLTILEILLVISDYVIQTLAHFQTSNIISCITSPWFTAVRSTCAAWNSIILE